MLHELGFDTDVNIDYQQFERLVLEDLILLKWELIFKEFMC